MQEVNKKIVDMLHDYPENVRELALDAIRLSETMPAASVAEQLQALVRNIVRRSNGKK